MPNVEVVAVMRRAVHNESARPKVRPWAYYALLRFGNETFRAPIKESLFDNMIRAGAEKLEDVS